MPVLRFAERSPLSYEEPLAGVGTFAMAGEHDFLPLLIHFRLEGVCESQLEGFNEQNSLFDLRFEQFESRGLPCIRVLMESSYGLAGSFACSGVAVLEVAPCDANGCPSATTK